MISQDFEDSHKLAELLTGIEQQVGLLARCRPVNLRSERRRQIDHLRRGATVRPQWEYAPPPPFNKLLHTLSELQRRLPHSLPLASLWVARVEELHLEARLAQVVGQREFCRLARVRFPQQSDSLAQRANQLARTWCEEPPPASTAATIVSDDWRHPDSLVRLLEAKLFAAGVQFRVSTSASLQSLAATGCGLVVAAAGVPLTRATGLRVATHEVLAHALPRHRARCQAHGIGRAGAAGSVEVEEGRALLIEEREQLLDGARRQQLGLRHELAVAGAKGQPWQQAVHRAHQVLGRWDLAVDAAARAYRGGGLFRESCYLWARAQLVEACAADPQLDAWLGSGRLTPSAVAALRDARIALRCSSGTS